MPARINGFRDPPDQPDLQRGGQPARPALTKVGTNVSGSSWPGHRFAGSGTHFAAAAGKSRLSIPHVTKELTCKYLTDLKLIGALEK
jgi:hypothetical protein